MTNNWGLLDHEMAVDMLRQQIVRGTLRHAISSRDRKGWDERTLALRLAQAPELARNQ